MDHETQAKEIIAQRAEKAGEFTFAREIRAGVWDHTNRNDIAAELDKLNGRHNAPR